MLDSSEGTFDLRYQETEDQEDVLVFEKIRKEKRLLQEHLNKYTISSQFVLYQLLSITLSPSATYVNDF